MNAPLAPSVLAPQTSNCARCAVLPLCLAGELSAEELTRFEAITWQRRIRRREHLCLGGGRFQSLFVIRSGTLKSSALRADGREQIVGFHMLGDFIGVEGLSTGMHTCDVLALEDCELCSISFQALERLARELPTLHRMINIIMSRQIVWHYKVMMMLANMRSDERVLAFLLNLSRRHAARGLSPDELSLPMTREDIGSYLGLKVETVSRVFSRLQGLGLIRVCRRHVRLLDRPAMQRKLPEVVGARLASAAGVDRANARHSTHSADWGANRCTDGPSRQIAHEHQYVTSVS